MLLVDTTVVSYALGKRHPVMTEPSKDLLRNAGEFAISAITAMELRLGRPDADVLKQLGDLKFYVVAADEEIALRAAELVVARFEADEELCDACRRPPKEYGTRDALIVATAMVVPDIDALYTWDKGMLGYAPFVSGCTVARPPQLPLDALLNR